jgi:hypothetical protein
MVNLTKQGIKDLELAERRYVQAVEEAGIVRSIRIGAILQEHGIDPETEGRFSRSGPNDVVFLPKADEAEAPKAE